MKSSVSQLLPRSIMVLVALIFAFDLPGLAPVAPPNVVGTWVWTWTDSAKVEHMHVLAIESTNGNLTGRERFDDKGPIKADDMVLRGQEISFVVTRDGRRAEYKGKVMSPNTINGLVNVSDKGQAKEYAWTAQREIIKK